MRSFDEFVRAVEQHTGRQGRRVGKETRLLCPAHDDHQPSLDAREGNDGTPLVRCRSCGAGLTEVCNALGIPQTDFLPDHAEGEWTPHGEAIAVYDYVDADGKLLYQVLRTAGKQFPQRRPDPTAKHGWRWNLEGVERVIYRLPQVRDACQFSFDTVYIAEGEKDVHALEQAGATATCNPGGAGKWRDAYSEQLRGAHDLAVVADQDKPGLEHAAQVVDSLRRVLGPDTRVRVVSARAGKDAHDHIAAGHGLDELVPLNGEVPATPVFALRLSEFLGLQLPEIPALLGTPDQAVIPSGGLVILAGLAGAGKTTLAIDAAFHLASGREWLGIETGNPLRILIVENEGPQRAFQRKLGKKNEAWEHELPGEIYVQTRQWGRFTLRDETLVDEFRHWLDEHQIDLVIGDPLDTLGTTGVGSPDDTRDFVELLPTLGLTTNRSFLFLHHLRKEPSVDEINRVSGAWGQRVDTLMLLLGTDRPDELRLIFSKARWSDDWHGKHLILGKVRNTAGFEVLAQDEPEPDDTAVEGMLRRIIGTLQRRGAPMERPALAVACETAPADRTYQRALSAGYNRDLLAKDRKGKKTYYALTEGAYFMETISQ